MSLRDYDYVYFVCIALFFRPSCFHLFYLTETVNDFLEIKPAGGHSEVYFLLVISRQLHGMASLYRVVEYWSGPVSLLTTVKAQRAMVFFIFHQKQTKIPKSLSYSNFQVSNASSLSLSFSARSSPLLFPLSTSSYFLSLSLSISHLTFPFSLWMTS